MFGWLRRIARRHPGPPPAPLPAGRGAAFYRALADRWGGEAGQRYSHELVAREVAELERRYRVKLPPDFRAYLLHAAPVEELFDDHLTAWWPIGRINTVSQVWGEWPEGDRKSPVARETGSWLVFADGMIMAWAWAICCSDGPDRGRVALLSGPDTSVVADEFREFVLLALEGADRIQPG